MEKRLIVIVAMPNNFALDITGPGDVFSSAKKIIAADVLKNYQMNYELLIVSATTEQDVLTNSGLLMRSYIPPPEGLAYKDLLAFAWGEGRKTLRNLRFYHDG